ncbi:23S rRNA pseudouridine(1911/1915/1917) synthase RluD [Accumulibacter sp.]|nr:23S rRNA pseudouridine(1911/1915/1917) synthase RluD [Accumulibacter sp.]
MGKPENMDAPTDATSRAPGAADYSANAGIALRVPVQCAGWRLDRVLAHLVANHSRSRLQNWVRAGRVTIAGVPTVEPRHKLWGGELIELAEVRDERQAPADPENIPLDIVFEDDSLIVLDKPAGLVVHPGNGNWHGTLLNALLHHAPQLDRLPRAGIVHRLDKDTSGLLVVAKTLEAQTHLVRQLQARSVQRLYYAVVHGIVGQAGTVDAPIGRHPTVRTRMAVVGSGKPARTAYRVLERFLASTLIECALDTGRTHQIRVHMTAIGHPLIGDPVYAGSRSGTPLRSVLARQALHAWRLALIHPLHGMGMAWTSELPADLLAVIERLRHEALRGGSGAARCELSADEEKAPLGRTSGTVLQQAVVGAQDDGVGEWEGDDGGDP